MDAEEVTAAALAARDGDTASAAAFVRATQAEVWRLCAHLADRESAGDLTQETYLRAFGSLRRFAGRSSARTWLLSIARRTCADHVRTLRRRPRESADPIPEVGEPDPSDAVVLRALLADLRSDRREAFVLTQVLGLSYADAAAVCDCPVGTIRSRVARARDELVQGVFADRREPTDRDTG